jgi:hypothetical protein
MAPPPAGPDQLTGTRLDSGFAPDWMLFANAWSGTIYLDQYALQDIGGAEKVYRGQGIVNSGQGLLSGGANPNGMRFALDNTNTAGVTDSSVKDAATAQTGIEIYLDLVDLGLTAAEVTGVKVAAFLLESSGDVSNQWLPPVYVGAGSLGQAPDLGAYPGDQFSVLSGVSGVDAGGAAAGRPGLELTASAGIAAGEEAVFSFRLAQAETVRLTVHDLGGRLVRTLIAGEGLPAGPHRVGWSGRDDAGRQVAAGMYLGLLEAGSLRATGKITLLR